MENVKGFIVHGYHVDSDGTISTEFVRTIYNTREQAKGAMFDMLTRDYESLKEIFEDVEEVVFDDDESEVYISDTAILTKLFIDEIY